MSEGDPELQQQVLDSALSQLPIIGDEFRTPEGDRVDIGRGDRAIAARTVRRPRERRRTP